VQHHAEQMLNALDVVQAGFGIADTTFRLDRLAELPDQLDNSRFRAWVSRSDEVLQRALLKSVAHHRTLGKGGRMLEVSSSRE
jgi:hypothetical protein